MINTLAIHNNNIYFTDKFTHNIHFNIQSYDFGKSDADTYISKQIIPQIYEKKPNIIFIKDILSTNAQEFYGLILAYHIRLSFGLENFRFVPIVILSEFDGYNLNRFSKYARILFTKGIFIGKNEIETLEFYTNYFEKLKNINEENFGKDFIENIEISPPQDYLSHHDITNEWSIYKWAKALSLKTEAIDKNNEKIENLLYFKYLKAKHNEKEEKISNIRKTITFQSVEKGKILYIDDQFDKGWADIIKKFLSSNNKISLDIYKNINKDTKKEELLMLLNEYVKKSNPELVILDFRLVEDDYENKNFEDFSSVAILKNIKKINPGIGVLLFSATSKSEILEKFYDNQILGYIKKEEPNDFTISTNENLRKFERLVNKGLKNGYLKEIYNLQNSIFNSKIPQEINLTSIKTTFDLLNSNNQEKFKFVVLTSIYNCYESLVEYYTETFTNKYGEKKAKFKEEFNFDDLDEEFENSIKIKIKQIKNGLFENKINDNLSQFFDTRNYHSHIQEKENNKQNKNAVIDIKAEHIILWMKDLKNIIKLAESFHDKPNN